MKLPNSLTAAFPRLLAPALAVALAVALPANAAPAHRVARPAAKKPAPSPTIRVVVDAKGRLRLTSAQMRALRPAVASNGLVCLEFPISILRKPPEPPKPPKSAGSKPGGAEGHEHSFQDNPPRVFITAAADGSLTLWDTPLIPGDERVPGAPGTVYLIHNKGGRLLVRKPGQKE